MGGEGGANFQKNRGVGGGGLDRISIFRGGSLGKRGVTFFRGVDCSFYIKKNKLKSEIFNDKKSL